MRSIRIRVLKIATAAACMGGITLAGQSGESEKNTMPTFAFEHQYIDTELGGRSFGQTALADLDRDGRPEFITGRSGGDIYWFDRDPTGRWTRHLLGRQSPSDVGGAALDVDGDGWIDFVTGGAWYRNPGPPGDGPFERIVFDAALARVHDVAIGDINGDGRPEVVSMSDKNNLRWYGIPADPRQPWVRHDIGSPVHAGLSLGDVDGDGDLDVVRTDVWFENVRGDGTEWTEHPIGPNTPPPPDFRPPFAFNATKSRVCDMNGDGRNDIVFVDAEIPGGKVWWMENLDGKGTRWLRHDIPNADPARRGAYHTLWVGDLDGDGDLDVFSCEMEGVGGVNPPRWYIWENLDGRGGSWREHVILDAGLGGHEAVVGDIDGDGRLDICSKLWSPRKDNANGGRMHVDFLRNVGP
ncbi:MAG: VCBS repeat-containing protein [Lentisphaeria bacterium]|nr:VCBS repeat-containing protein [Lentisphaeria bacterium]